jgi:hypothetical protein
MFAGRAGCGHAAKLFFPTAFNGRTLRAETIEICRRCCRTLRQCPEKICVEPQENKNQQNGDCAANGSHLIVSSIQTFQMNNVRYLIVNPFNLVTDIERKQ